MFPAAAILSGAATLAGGLLQRDAITKATEERMRLMRRRAEAKRGEYLAAVGATGVEMTSATVQDTINRMKMESDLAIRNAGLAGGAMGDNSIISALGGAASSLFKGFADMTAEDKAFGSQPGFTMDESALDAGASQLNKTLGWKWDF